MAEILKPNADTPAEDSVVNGTFRWTIINFSRMEAGKRHYSDVFHIGRTKWQVLLLGRTDIGDLSMYLRNAENLDFGWSRHAKFSLRIISQLRPELSHKKDASYKYHKRVTDWGFKSYISFKALMNPEKGFLLKDTLIIEAEVYVSKIVGLLKPLSAEAIAPVSDTGQAAGFGRLQAEGSAEFSNPQQLALGAAPTYVSSALGSDNTEMLPSILPTIFKSSDALGWSDRSIQAMLENKRRAGEEKVRSIQKNADKLTAEVEACEKKLEAAKQGLHASQQAAQAVLQELAAAKKSSAEDYQRALKAIAAQRKKVEQEFRLLQSLIMPTDSLTSMERGCEASMGVPGGTDAQTGDGVGESTERSGDIEACIGEGIAAPRGEDNREGEGIDFTGPGIHVGSVDGRDGDRSGVDESLEDRPLAFLAAEMAAFPSRTADGQIPDARERELEGDLLLTEGTSLGRLTVGSLQWWQNVADVAAELMVQVSSGTLKRSRDVEEQLEKFENEAKRLKYQQDQL